MFSNFPKTYDQLKDWTWAQYEPYVNELAARELNVQNVSQYLSDWTLMSFAFNEVYSRLAVANSQDTTDKEVEAKYFAFLPGRRRSRRCRAAGVTC